MLRPSLSVRDPTQTLRLPWLAQKPHDPLPERSARKLFHGIRPPLVIAAIEHVWHAAGREVADGHPFPASAHIREFARAVNDAVRPFGLGRISLPGIHDKVLVATRVHELAAAVFVVLAAD